jgi:hypothetical protein
LVIGGAHRRGFGTVPSLPQPSAYRRRGRSGRCSFAAVAAVGSFSRGGGRAAARCV